MIYALGKNSPKIDKGCFIAPSADIIGNVKIGGGSSVWFNATIRGDLNAIIIGRDVSIQDNCVLHAERATSTEIGDSVVIGHRSIVHASMIGSNTIIGMGAILLSRSKIGKNCIIAAGSVVTEDTVIPDGSIAVGIPAKVTKQTSADHVARIQANVREYKELNAEYLKEGSFRRYEQGP